MTVATRQSEGLLRARGSVRLRTPAPALSGRYLTSNPCGKATASYDARVLDLLGGHAREATSSRSQAG